LNSRIPKMLNVNSFETTSLVKAAFLEVRLGVSCAIRFNNPKEGVFVFPRTDEVVEAASAFDSDGEISAKRYSRAVSTLRDRLWGLRQGIHTENVNRNDQPSGRRSFA
jgi:hypothetical protein